MFFGIGMVALIAGVWCRYGWANRIDNRSPGFFKDVESAAMELTSAVLIFVGVMLMAAQIILK